MVRRILPSNHMGGPMTQQEERLQAFFVRYGEALAAGDLPTIADCYTVPA
jgi:hypothetical protein